MTAEDLRKLYEYGCWANGQLFRVVSELSAEEFTRDVAGGRGSVRTTLVHIMSAEWGWVARCGGPPRGPRPDPNDYATFDELIARWHVVEEGIRRRLATLHDGDLSRTIEFEIDGNRGSLTIEKALLHAVMHGVHHRGQVALLLRELDRSPGNFDLLFYTPETALPSSL